MQIADVLPSPWLLHNQGTINSTYGANASVVVPGGRYTGCVPMRLVMSKCTIKFRLLQSVLYYQIQTASDTLSSVNDIRYIL